DSVRAGRLASEGKTKRIWETKGQPLHVVVESKDDLTAGDGAKHDVINGKASLSNRTTSNVFRLLKECGLPVAFVEEIDETRFLAERCAMIPYEVVVRREAHGSFLKRHPGLPKGHIFPRLLLEFFLKTSGRHWKDIDLPKDDPFLRFDGDRASLYVPDQPIHQQTPFLTLEDFPLRGSSKVLEEMGTIALKAFLILEKAWQLVGRRLVDFKVEFGRNVCNDLRLADVIDNDSWRVLDGGGHLDKQLYRCGSDLDTVAAKYRLVADLTENFGLPRQRLILWRASQSDGLKPFGEALVSYGAQGVCGVHVVTCSLHKEPVRAYEEIGRLIQEVPDSVVIAYCGRSNGAGPTLSAQAIVPVITVPATWREFPEDVWSSLRTPSETPVATVLDPRNAVLLALQILAMRNPRLYAELRLRQEERLCNIVKL
ncbi:MAG: phosphoribosylaminoimidazolesuccinocarboxamide synthase, partial [Patescibacteria group bacterium]|nr:phosphoribosylaminoimidazolesuccinocarboxamide synthase [Patescibacteria group bacterium]